MLLYIIVATSQHWKPFTATHWNAWPIPNQIKIISQIMKPMNGSILNLLFFLHRKIGQAEQKYIFHIWNPWRIKCIELFLLSPSSLVLGSKIDIYWNLCLVLLFWDFPAPPFRVVSSIHGFVIRSRSRQMDPG